MVPARFGPVLPQKRLRKSAYVALLLLFTTGACRTKKTWPVSFSKEELRERLTPMQYHVTQERGTESAFTGELTFNKEEGTYSCVVCGTPLFSSKTKFDSGSGWPSFFDLLKKEAVTVTDDFSYGMHRVETTCSQTREEVYGCSDRGHEVSWCKRRGSRGFTVDSSEGNSSEEEILNNAELTWDTCSTTDQNRRGSATASTPLLWPLHPPQTKVRPSPRLKGPLRTPREQRLEEGRIKRTRLNSELQKKFKNSWYAV